jgi:hypothetical protein
MALAHPQRKRSTCAVELIKLRANEVLVEAITEALGAFPRPSMIPPQIELNRPLKR